MRIKVPKIGDLPTHNPLRTSHKWEPPKIANARPKFKFTLTCLFAELDDQLTEKISRIAFLEREMQEYRQQSVNLDTATLYYASSSDETAAAAPVSSVGIAEIFDHEVVAVRSHWEGLEVPTTAGSSSQALDFSKF